MSKLTHMYTPGPWEIVYRDDINSMCMTVIAPKGALGDTSNCRRLIDDPNAEKVIAIAFHQSMPVANYHAEDFDANARLIAAAPELLALLEDLLDPDFNPNSYPIWEETANKVIARVKGEAE